jgi:hypothetical protein
LLFNTLLAFAVFFMLTFVFVNPKVKHEKNVEAKADMIITVTWEKTQMDDVDTWVEDPGGGIVYFRDKEENLMHLDRDDLGKANDVVVVNGQKFEYKENREMVTIRGMIPGEYVVNVHMYSKRVEGPTEVNVIVEKLNPTLTLCASKTVTLHKTADEVTAFRFTVNKKGEVIDINDLPKQIVREKVGHMGGMEGEEYYDDGMHHEGPYPDGMEEGTL